MQILYQLPKPTHFPLYKKDHLQIIIPYHSSSLPKKKIQKPIDKGYNLQMYSTSLVTQFSSSPLAHWRVIEAIACKYRCNLWCSYIEISEQITLVANTLSPTVIGRTNCCPSRRHITAWELFVVNVSIHHLTVPILP